MNLLTQQLTSFREKHKIHVKNPKFRVSFLYSKEEAKQISIDDVRSIGLQSLDALSEEYPYLNNYRSLFSGRGRDFLTKEENQIRNNLINDFFLSLSPIFETRHGLNCVEAMLVLQDAHVHNIDGLIQLALPYHQTPAFVRLIQILVIPSDSRWLLLKTIQQTKMVPTRDVIVHMIKKDPSLFNFICQTVLKTVKESEKVGPPSKQLASFFGAVSVQVLAEHDDKETSLRTVLIIILQILKKPQWVELHYSSLLILSHALVAVPNWDMKVFEKMLIYICRYPNASTLSFLAFATRGQEIPKLPLKVIEYLRESTNLETSLLKLDAEPLLQQYGKSLVVDGDSEVTYYTNGCLMEVLDGFKETNFVVAFVQGCLQGIKKSSIQNNDILEDVKNILTYLDNLDSVACGLLRGQFQDELPSVLEHLPIRPQALHDSNWEVRLQALEDNKKIFNECAILIFDKHPEVQARALNMKRIWKNIGCKEGANLLSTLLHNVLLEIDLDTAISVDVSLTASIIDSLRPASQEIVASALRAFSAVLNRSEDDSLTESMNIFIGPFIHLAKKAKNEAIREAAELFDATKSIPSITKLQNQTSARGIMSMDTNITELPPLGGLIACLMVCSDDDRCTALFGYIWEKIRLQPRGTGVRDMLRSKLGNIVTNVQVNIICDSPQDFPQEVKKLLASDDKLYYPAFAEVNGWSRSIAHALIFITNQIKRKQKNAVMEKKWMYCIVGRMTHKQKMVRVAAMSLLEQILQSIPSEQEVTWPRKLFEEILVNKQAIIEDAEYLGAALQSENITIDHVNFIFEHSTPENCPFGQSKDFIAAYPLIRSLPALPFLQVLSTVTVESEWLGRTDCKNENKVNHFQEFMKTIVASQLTAVVQLWKNGNKTIAKIITPFIKSDCFKILGGESSISQDLIACVSERSDLMVITMLTQCIKGQDLVPDVVCNPLVVSVLMNLLTSSTTTANAATGLTTLVSRMNLEATKAEEGVKIMTQLVETLQKNSKKETFAGGSYPAFVPHVIAVAVLAERLRLHPDTKDAAPEAFTRCIPLLTKVSSVVNLETARKTVVFAHFLRAFASLRTDNTAAVLDPVINLCTRIQPVMDPLLFAAVSANASDLAQGEIVVLLHTVLSHCSVTQDQVTALASGDATEDIAAATVVASLSTGRSLEDVQQVLKALSPVDRVHVLAHVAAQLSEVLRYTFVQSDKNRVLTTIVPTPEAAVTVAKSSSDLLHAELRDDSFFVEEEDIGNAHAVIVEAIHWMEVATTKKNMVSEVAKETRKERYALQTMVTGFRSAFLRKIFRRHPDSGLYLLATTIGSWEQYMDTMLGEEYLSASLRGFYEAVETISLDNTNKKRLRKQISEVTPESLETVINAIRPLLESSEATTGTLLQRRKKKESKTRPALETTTVEAVWTLCRQLTTGAVVAPNAFGCLIPLFCESTPIAASVGAAENICTFLLAKQLLPHVNILFPALASAVEKNIEGAYGALSAAVSSIGSFASPFLKTLINLAIAQSTTTMDHIIFKTIQELGHAQSFPVVTEIVSSLEAPSLTIAQRVACYFRHTIESAQEDLIFYKRDVVQSINIFVKVAEQSKGTLSPLIFRAAEEDEENNHWNNIEADSISGLEGHVGRILGQFVLRIEVGSLEKLIDQLLRTARCGRSSIFGLTLENKENKEHSDDDSPKQKKKGKIGPLSEKHLSHCSMWWSMWRALIAEGSDEIAQLFTKLDADVISILGVCLEKGSSLVSFKKRKRGVPLEPAEERYIPHIIQHILRAIKESLDAVQGDVFSKQMLASFVEPMVNLLDCVTPEIQKTLGEALISLVHASGEEGKKGIMHALVHKARSSIPQVRLAAVQMSEVMWAELGSEIISSLQIFMLFVAELLEDQEQDVEDATRSMIRVIEDKTGEDIQSLLKN